MQPSKNTENLQFENSSDKEVERIPSGTEVPPPKERCVNEADRLKAVDSLIGRVSAFSQIDARYLARVQALRQRRKTMRASLLANVSAA